MLLWHETGYFDVAAAAKPLLHLWSLGIEEQYYVVWPLLLWAAYRWRLNLGAMVVVLLLGSFTLMMQWPRMEAFYFLPSRFWELLLGGGLAYLERYYPGGMDAALARAFFRWKRQRDASTLVPLLADLKGVVAVVCWCGPPLPWWMTRRSQVGTRYPQRWRRSC